MDAWNKAKWNFMFGEFRGAGDEIEQIQSFSDYSHVEQHQRKAKKNQIVRWDYFLFHYVQAATVGH